MKDNIDELLVGKEPESLQLNTAKFSLFYLLAGKEPESMKSTTVRFKPQFNVREEYVVWVREQFPDLKYYAKKKKVYAALTERKKEIMEGAKLAYEHALQKTDGCARNGFMVTYALLAGDKSRVEQLDGAILDYQKGDRVYYHMTGDDYNIADDNLELFPRYLENFLQCIERSSMNLDDSNGKHYGTKIRRR